MIERGRTVGFDYESIPPGYYDEVFHRGAGIQSKWHQMKFRRVAEEMTGHRRHLDVGCGPGTLIGVIDSRHESVGIDISHNQIAYARRRRESPTSSFYVCSARDLPAELHDFDVATVVEVIEHLVPEQVDDVLSGTIERLRPGGKLVVTTPNFRSAWPLMEALVNRFGKVKYSAQHINKFTPRLLREQLRDLGLVDVEVKPYLVLAPFAAAFSWRAADVIGRLERGPFERAAGLLLLGTGVKP